MITVWAIKLNKQFILPNNFLFLHFVSKLYLFVVRILIHDKNFSIFIKSLFMHATLKRTFFEYQIEFKQESSKKMLEIKIEKVQFISKNWTRNKTSQFCLFLCMCVRVLVSVFALQVVVMHMSELVSMMVRFRMNNLVNAMNVIKLFPLNKSKRNHIKFCC